MSGLRSSKGIDKNIVTYRLLAMITLEISFRLTVLIHCDIMVRVGCGWNHVNVMITGITWFLNCFWVNLKIVVVVKKRCRCMSFFCFLFQNSQLLKKSYY